MTKTFCFNGFCSIVETVKGKDPRFIVEGLASTNLTDLVDDVITEEALRGAAADLLKSNTVFLNHDRKIEIGSVIGAEFDPVNKAIRVRILISNTRPDIQQKIKENILNKMSIGGMVLLQKPGKHPRTGKSVNFIIRIKLHEVSLVGLPANPDARGLSWSLEKGFEGWRQDGKRKGGDYQVKLKIKQKDGKPVLDDSNRPLFEDEDGKTVSMDDIQRSAPEPTPDPDPEPEATADFEVPEDRLKEIEAEETAKAETATKVKQIGLLCDALEQGPDEGASKIGKMIRDIADKIDFGQSSEPDAGDTVSTIRRAVADALTDAGVITTKGAPDKGRPGTGRKGVSKGQEEVVPTPGDESEAKEKALIAEIEKLPAGKARLAAIARLGRLKTQLDD